MKASTALSALTVLMLAGALCPACAEYWDWDGLHSGPPTRHRIHRAPTYYRAPPVRYYRTPEDERPRAERSDRRADESFYCVGRVRGLGTQWIGVPGALDAARKDWMERVRYDHGEKYLDMTNSRDFESRCGRVSIGEVVGQVTYRCEIWARPCKAVIKEDEHADARQERREERQEELEDRR